MSGIKQALEMMTKQEATVFPCTVLSVNKSEATCELQPVSGAAKLFDVRLRAAIDGGKQVIMFPEVGSTVLACMLSSTEAFVCFFSEIESVLMEVGTAFKLRLNSDGTLFVNAEKITVNDGTNGGLVLLPQLQLELQKIANFLNTLRLTLQSSVPVPERWWYSD